MNDGHRGQRGRDPYQGPYQPYEYEQGYQDPAYQDPGYQDPAYQDPGYQDPAYQDPGYRDPGYQDPGYGYDPYAPQQPPYPQAPPQQPYPPQGPPPQQPYHQGPPQGPPPPQGYDPYDPYGPAASTGEQLIPQQRPPGPEQRDYHTEQFAFVEDSPDASEDVIDWMKFTESRTERREEAKRRGRNRKVALLLVAVLAVLGGTGYLWVTDRLGFLPGSGSGAAAAGEEKRDVIVVHLRDTDGGSASALLVNNSTTERGTTVLLPNDLAVSGDDGGATTLGKAVEEEGAGATRDAIDGLLGSQIKGSWRLDTPYLEILVEGVSGITIDANATVPGKKEGDEPFAKEGKARDLNGQQAIEYATYQAEGEPQTAQLARFGQVMDAVLKKLPSDEAGVRSIVKSLAMISDPSLSEAQLSASLAGLAEQSKQGAYSTEMLEIGKDGRPSEAATESVVKDVLGGTVKAPAGDAAARVSLQNAAGSAGPAEQAKVALVNGGFTFIDGGKGEAVAKSEVRYADEAARAQAEEVAKTLGLPVKAVAKGKTPANADVSVILGEDYHE